MSRKTEANLDCVFVKNALIFIDPSIGGALTPPGPPSPTPPATVCSTYTIKHTTSRASEGSKSKSDS